MSIIPCLRKQRWEEHKFNTTLSYIVRSCIQNKIIRCLAKYSTLKAHYIKFPVSELSHRNLPPWLCNLNASTNMHTNYMQIYVGHWKHVCMRTGLCSKLFMSYKELPAFLKWFHTEAAYFTQKIFYYLSPAPPIFKNELTQFFDDNNIVGGSEYRSGQGRRRKGGGGKRRRRRERGRSQKLNHSHVSNLRVFFFLRI